MWISGLRHDITMAVMYLTWNTKQPRRHHLNVALRVISYLAETRGFSLTLGGRTPFSISSESDASLGTGPNGRSIIAFMIRLGHLAGAVIAKSKAIVSVCLSSFEAELDAACSAIKAVTRVKNILTELGVRIDGQALLECDNEAMINFIEGRATAKGVRHMELRKWYVREMKKKEEIKIQHKSGAILDADKLTKPTERVGHRMLNSLNSAQ